MNQKSVRVLFVNDSLEKSFLKLKNGTTEDQHIAEWIQFALSDLSDHPDSGIRIPKKLWPREYSSFHSIDNLWKLDLPKGWRLIYTLRNRDIEILAIVIEWFDHKDYERRFKY